MVLGCHLAEEWEEGGNSVDPSQSVVPTLERDVVHTTAGLPGWDAWQFVMGIIIKLTLITGMCDVRLAHILALPLGAGRAWPSRQLPCALQGLGPGQVKAGRAGQKLSCHSHEEPQETRPNVTWCTWMGSWNRRRTVAGVGGEPRESG